jgi:hypothetical protein
MTTSTNLHAVVAVDAAAAPATEGEAITARALAEKALHKFSNGGRNGGN